MGNLLEVITEGGREAPCAPLVGGRVFLFPCHKELFSSDGVLVASVLPRTWLEDVLVGRYFWIPCLAPRRVSIQKHRLLALLTCPHLCAYLVLFGSCQGWFSPKRKVNGTSGMGFLCCPVNPLLLWWGPRQCHTRPDAQGSASTAFSRRDFLTPQQELKRLCLHVSIWSVPSFPDHVTWRGTLWYLKKKISTKILYPGCMLSLPLPL